MVKTMKTRRIKQSIHEYTAVFERNEHDGYTVTVPSLPGLITQGKDLEDARRMAEDAIRCHLGGLQKIGEEIPTEREVAHVRVSVKV